MKEKNFEPAPEIKNFSIFLESAKEAKKQKEELEDRIAERIKFINTEEARLELIEETQPSSTKEINRIKENIDLAQEDIKRLSREKLQIENDIAECLLNEKITKNMLDDANTNLEH